MPGDVIRNLGESVKIGAALPMLADATCRPHAGDHALTAGSASASLASGGLLWAQGDAVVGAILVGIGGIAVPLAKIVFDFLLARHNSTATALQARLDAERSERQAADAAAAHERGRLEDRVQVGLLNEAHLRLEIERITGQATRPPPDLHTPEGQALLLGSGMHPVAFAARKLLIVEDEPGIVAMLERLFRHYGCTVAHASSVDQALARLAAETPEVLILDLMLPGGGGEKVLERVRADHPGMRVVVLTALPEGDRLDRVRAFGVEGLMAKPYDVDELIRTVLA